MTELRDIAQLGAKVLRQHAEAVTDVRSEETREIIAAPQISESKQIIIVASRPTARYPTAPLMPATVMINPGFQALTEHKEKGWEGCLSIPGIRALVPRYTAIKIHYLDEQGTEQTAELHDFVAQVFQHEFDHLQGKVFLDRVENNQDIVAESEYLKIIL